VIDACKGVEGADAAKAQEVWDGVDVALTGVADDASLPNSLRGHGPGDCPAGVRGRTAEAGWTFRIAQD